MPPAYGIDFVDRRNPAAVPMQMSAPANWTGMPDRLKSGIEALSGMDLSDVRVHANSDKPAALGALAYARGDEIHLAPGYEQHLPHEAWHVVQQRQGRVKPTLRMAGDVSINDDRALEREAEMMGARASGNLENETLDRKNLRKQERPAVDATAQLIPDKEQLYWQRLQQAAGAPALGVGLSQHLTAFIINPANVAKVGQNVVNAVTPLAAAAPVALPALQIAVLGAVTPQLAAPGQYAADTANNGALTVALQANPFIQGVMNGTLHAAVPGWRNVAPVAGAIPAPAAGADDRVLETVDLFNRLTNIPGGLPAVQVNPIWGPHAAMGAGGQMDLGWAAARGNILHEFGHLLEDNLGPADFATIHNFLTARTQVPAGGLGAAAMAGMRDAGYFFESHPGYQVDMPEINAGGMAGRRQPQTRWQRIWHAVSTPYTWLKQKVSRAYHATPLRYVGLLGSAVTQQLGKLASVMFGRRELRNWGAAGVENFFVHNANNPQLSYSTAVHRFGGVGYTGTTEYLSTTTEFFNRPSHARELVRVDPLRVALFLYVANRPQYLLVRAAFNAATGLELNNLIHAVR